MSLSLKWLSSLDHVYTAGSVCARTYSMRLLDIHDTKTTLYSALCALLITCIKLTSSRNMLQYWHSQLIAWQKLIWSPKNLEKVAAHKQLESIQLSKYSACGTSRSGIRINSIGIICLKTKITGKGNFKWQTSVSRKKHFKIIFIFTQLTAN